MATMYRSGVSLATVAREFQISRERVRQCLEDVGVARRPSSMAAKIAARNRRSDGPHNHNLDVEADALLMRENGLSAGQIAQKLGVTRNRVIGLLWRADQRITK